MKQTLREYIEGRMSCGSVLLSVIGIVAVIVLLPIQIKKLAAVYGGSGFFLLSMVLFIAAVVIACSVWFKSQENNSKRMGVATLIGAVPQIVMGIAYLTSDALKVATMGWAPLMFALLLLVLGWAIIVFPKD